MTPEVHVIDDDDAIRLLVGRMLRNADIAVRTYASAMEFFDILDDIDPSCVITDLRLPVIDGVDLIRRLRARGSNCPIIVISGQGDILQAVAAMKAGAADFIEKPFQNAVLLEAVRAAIDAEKGAAQRSDAQRNFADMLRVLSPREQEVLQSVIAGNANKIIARELGISHRTVEVHRANVMSKTGATSLSALLRMALLAEG